jgi:hypothetical protein
VSADLKKYLSPPQTFAEPPLLKPEWLGRETRAHRLLQEAMLRADGKMKSDVTVTVTTAVALAPQT